MKNKYILLTTVIISIFISFIGCKANVDSSEPTQEDIVMATDIKLSKTNITLKVGNSETVTAIVSPSNTTDKTLVWKSSNTSVATVKDGIINGISVGETTVTVTCGSVKKTINVIVADNVVYVTELELSTESVSLVVGKSETVTATVNPSNATDKTVTWYSNDESIATVLDGVITAVSKGTVIITATAGSIIKEINVTVSEKEIPVTDFELSCSSLVLGIGDAEDITVVFTPENATSKTIVWTSDDTNIASVENGTITGVDIGTTEIVATCGAISKKVSVEVKESVIPVSSISLSVDNLYLNKNQSATLVATVLPENVTDKTVVWKSSDTSIATVIDGVVTAINYGTATITASSGTKSSTTNVVVCIPVETISLSSENISLCIGESETITATVYPSNATDKTITWSSSNESVATVSNGVITAVMGGTTTITATAGGISNSCFVTVVVPVTNIILSENSISLVTGSTYKIKATVNPSNATDKIVTWSSSNESIATVENGLITAVSVGNTQISATAGDKVTYVDVVVNNTSGAIPVSNILLSQDTVNMKIGESQTVFATVNPINADDTTVVWTSDNETVASVSYGIITGKTEGSTIITASVGEVSKIITVYVTQNNIPIGNITISPNVFNLVVGGTKTIVPNILPVIATERTITWTSSDNSIASVSSTGLVTAKKIGYVTITATAQSGVSADAIFVISEPGFTVSLPDNANYTDDDYIDLTYTKKGNVYTFKASSTKQCGYIAFYVNGEQKIDIWSNGTKYEEYSVDITTITKKYLTVYAFGMYDAGNDADGIINDIIVCREQITIDLSKEN